MDIDSLKKRIPDYAKDIRLNLGSVLSQRGAPGLTDSQIAGIALACAYAGREPSTIDAIERAARDVLTDAEFTAAQAAASIMAMNNVYYRFLHLVGDNAYQQLPAGLRMQVIGNPGIDKVDFELYSIAVSAINGCGLCIESHEKVLRKADVSQQAIQSAVKIAAVIHAVSATLDHPRAAELEAAA